MAENYIDPWGYRTTGAQSRPGTKHAYWIHEKVKAKESVTGYYYLPDCICSNCGFYSRRELQTCRKCGAVMDAPQPGRR
ncbi:MAG: hypothetical protein J6S26_05070 [Solobacterium sp.]|nr:hypothetical protein [Solobacterium sp.]